MDRAMVIKRIVTYKEDVLSENATPTGGGVRRAWAAAVIANPARGLNDMSALTDLGAELGEQLGGLLLSALAPQPGQPLSPGLR